MANFSPIVSIDSSGSWWDVAISPGTTVQGKAAHFAKSPKARQACLAWVAARCHRGADNQVQVNLQILTHILDFNADPQTALEAPRWTSSQAGQGANYPHTGDGRLTIEEDFGPEILANLESRGHTLVQVPHLGGPCAMQAIRILDNNIRQAASDPRRDGWAAAY